MAKSPKKDIFLQKKIKKNHKKLNFLPKNTKKIFKAKLKKIHIWEQKHIFTTKEIFLEYGKLQ